MRVRGEGEKLGLGCGASAADYLLLLTILTAHCYSLVLTAHLG